jgi:hypothetical protein
MSNLGRTWEQNVRKHGFAAAPRFYPRTIHTLYPDLPTGLLASKSAPVLAETGLSTNKAVLIIITKED